ncbi:cation diffusion facilitator family transporter [Roseivirga misakiensis]|uniref:Cobalt transporter n=1 Tax=Roseivirga misakiensis TaxID=1563681 RepID=A0A1E5T360_9BACT|nr:cation diffusion facilitator family transporter [Roseivirga misakiensis]OEK05819.1 cobalt transporter [Roseivirga misakiensis]
MGHHHHHAEHSHGSKNLKVAFFLNFSFTIIEFIGGLLTGSLAILSDALHDLGDSISIGLSWYFQHLSDTKDSNQKYTYGYKRFSLLGAIINAGILLVGSVIIISQAAPQVFNPGEVDDQGMLIIAIFGVIVNGAAVLRLKKGKSMNERVIRLHLLEDVLGWLTVLLGSLLIMYFDWQFIDPLLSVLIGVFIIYNVIANLKKSFSIILQTTPADVDIPAIHDGLKSIPEIIDIHDCHVWSMDGEYHVLSAHVVLDKVYSLRELTEIKSKAKLLLADLNIKHSTLEFEEDGEECEGC